ncbi:thioredoxin family protein [Mycoplasma corogypsi]|uniref:thioredoxin family protein n=1 Tax=Mycoplasma corogypsi TaxID=2106 RepID=UPI00387321BB
MMHNSDKKYVSEHLGEGLELVVFYADWCGPCNMFKETLEQLVKEYPTINVYRVNIDNDRDYALEMGVSNIPAYAIYKDGKVVSKQTGYRPLPALVELLKEYM